MINNFHKIIIWIADVSIFSKKTYISLEKSQQLVKSSGKLFLKQIYLS